jgi:hypothetical protein
MAGGLRLRGGARTATKLLRLGVAGAPLELHGHRQPAWRYRSRSRIASASEVEDGKKIRHF